ncbi:hypothetical protein PORY_002787 [Pneumocystis oryctolagi]|uniref:Uncharacterized protein n=1 Tax=Pneumocystis oryctolagi TaxID=42067 RepID=A0ACB7CBF1_9ASCO|nr:hypothetical protein PORY_002787 [Pneumocystis oryctolagi]
MSQIDSDTLLKDELFDCFGNSIKDNPTVLEECLSILKLYSISPIELFYRWESWCLKMGNEPQLFIIKIIILIIHQIWTINHNLFAFTKNNDYISTTSVSNFSINSEKIIKTLNSHISSFNNRNDINEKQKKISLSINFDPKKYSFKIMYQKLSEISEVLDDKIDIFTEELIKCYDLSQDDFGNPAHISHNEIIAVGRIICDFDSEGSLNSDSIILETSRRFGSGSRVLLYVDNLNSYSLFPGQILGVKGTNFTGAFFSVRDFLMLPLLPFSMTSLLDFKKYNSLLNGMHQKIFVASGPYTANDNILFEPLVELCNKIEEEKPDVVILIGPFLDIKHPLVSTGDFNIEFLKNDVGSLDDLFKQCISSKLNKLDCLIIMIPHIQDVCCRHAAWPQNCFNKKSLGLGNNVKCVPSPSLFSLNEVIIGISSNDILMPLSKFEIIKSPLYSDTLSRLSYYLIQQRHFYPLFPGVDGANLDIAFMGLGEFSEVLPDILILPSDLQSFAKIFGSYAVMYIEPRDLEKVELTDIDLNHVMLSHDSSGKSSVLEAIIGHNFLPKGVDMVTRRPIELTLIHTFDTEEYGEFPDLKQRVGFDQIQKIIADLNFCVSENDYISDEPIKLNIFSPNVPDLTLIDLPGYIQVESKDQPISLKNKIIELCDKYIQEPNIILAVSAADVDLANSAALHASRKVDPNGIRTIGVVTKMDLVTPERGYKILKNINYPLNLGYVGVISNFPVHSFFDKNINLFDLIVENEKKYFSSFEEFNNDNCFVGIMTLREKLVKILENIMVHNLENIYGTLKSELEETSYQLKVEYNDRYLTPEIYMAELVDILKHRFKRFVDNFGKPKIRIMLKDIMNQKVLDLLAEKYWIDESIFELSKKCNNDIYWKHKLDLSTSCLTKLGIGRLVTGLLTSTIISEMEKIAEEDQFKMHPYVTQCIIQSTRSILKERYHNTVEQVENCVKPYKHEIDIDENEWKLGRESSLRILKKEIEMCQDSIKELKNSIGSKKLEEIISWIISGKNGSENMEYSTSLIEKGQHAIFLRDRENVLNARLKFLRSEKCKNMINGHYCPEIFLEIVAKKIVDIAVLFVDVELFSEFIHQFPRDLDNQLVYNLTSEQLEKIARENYEVGKQIDLQQKKALLELVLEKIKSLMLSGKNITDNPSFELDKSYCFSSLKCSFNVKQTFLFLISFIYFRDIFSLFSRLPLSSSSLIVDSTTGNNAFIEYNIPFDSSERIRPLLLEMIA